MGNRLMKKRAYPLSFTTGETESKERRVDSAIHKCLAGTATLRVTCVLTAVDTRGGGRGLLNSILATRKPPLPGWK